MSQLWESETYQNLFSQFSWVLSIPCQSFCISSQLCPSFLLAVTYTKCPHFLNHPLLLTSPTPLSRSPCLLHHRENWGHQSRTHSISSPATYELIYPSHPFLLPSYLSENAVLPWSEADPSTSALDAFLALSSGTSHHPSLSLPLVSTSSFLLALCILVVWTLLRHLEKAYLNPHFFL